MRFAGVLRSLLLLSTFTLACKSAESPPAAPTAAAEPTPEARRPAPGEEQAAKMEERKPSDAAAANPPPPSPDFRDDPIESELQKTERTQSRLDIAVPSINGGLNRDIIRRIASDHADEIRECHGRALASMPDLAGKLIVEVELDAKGNVTDAKLGEDSSLQSRDVESCVLALIEGWSFADAGGKGSAALSFEF